MRIHCPFCGERDIGDFAYLGDANVTRPDADAPDAQHSFIDAVYLRNNPRGRHDELWYHASGCRSWLRVSRDTQTHQILAVAFASEEAGS